MKRVLISLATLVLLVQAHTFNPEMQTYMDSLKTQALRNNPDFKTFDYKRGEKIFTSEYIGKKGKLISCVSCHTKNLGQSGENVSTGKAIEPLSPAINPKRFSKVKNVKKWLRRNFKDVYKREGSAQEKGDVITYIVNKK